MFKIRTLLNLPLGVAIGVIFALGICAVFDADVSENLTKFYTFLGSAVLSLFAAAVALSGVLANLQKQDELVERRHVAARVVLPIVLSRLYSIAERGFDTVMTLDSFKASDREAALTSLKLIEIPPDDLTKIRDCVEVAGPQVQAWLTLILAHWQIEVARLESKFDENLITVKSQQYSSAVDWLIIRAMIIHLFDYSRTGRAPSSTLNKDSISIPLLSQHMNNVEVRDKIAARHDWYLGNYGYSLVGFQKRLVSRKT